MAPDTHDRTLRALLSTARYEVLPTATIHDTVLEHVPRERTLTVTASPAKGLGATLELAEQLSRQGYRVVPHLAARMVSGRSELGEIVDRLTGAGIGGVFVPAGDASPPAGDYPDSVTLLRDLAELGDPFGDVGVTGYPESHPSVPEHALEQAMWDKRDHATYLVSNLCFDPRAVQAWVHRLRDRGIALPVLVGVPGRVQRAKLLSTATRIGVGESTKFLSKHRSLLTRIASPRGFSARRFIERTAPLAADPAAEVAGLHVYTFNQVLRTETWLTDWLAELDGGSRQDSSER